MFQDTTLTADMMCDTDHIMTHPFPLTDVVMTRKLILRQTYYPYFDKLRGELPRNNIVLDAVNMDAIMRRTSRNQFIQVATVAVDRQKSQKAFGSQGVAKKGESVFQALRPLYPLARLLALPDNDEKFTWWNWKTISCLFLLAWSLFLSLMTVIKVAGESISYFSVGQISFYCIVTVYLSLFLKLSTEWPDLMEEWLDVEQQMAGLPSVRVFRKIRFIFISIFIYGIVEHLLCQVHNLEKARLCSENNSIERFFIESYYSVFMHIQFSLWLGILLAIINFFLTLVWTFTDVFLICVCIALSARFEQLQISLKRIIGQDMSQEFWRESRKRYIKLSFLVKNVDEKCSLLMLFTFFNNVYSICCLLYKTLKWRDLTTIHTIYNCAAFLLVTVRLYGICLAAGRIHDLSHDILPILFSVPSQSYNVEVHRLFLQIWQDPVSLTGSRFFSITRGLVLKITGTIFTYEIVLAQFNQISPENENSMPQSACYRPALKLKEA